MSITRIAMLAGFWILSMAVAGYAGSQGGGITYPKGIEPLVISGENIGFRVEGHQGGARTGTLVVRIDGKWIEARSAVKFVPAK